MSSHSGRARIVSLVGIVLVPVVAYGVPHVSPYAAVPIAAVLAMAFVLAKPSSPLRELGLHRPARIWRALALGVTVGIALLLVNRLVLTPLIEVLTGTRRDLSSFDYLRGNPRALLALLPYVWISAGLCEEVVYRGYLISQARTLVGESRPASLVAVACAAILFALAHGYQNVSGMIVTGTLGAVFGLLFLQQRGNLWANVVAHTTGDTASLILISLSWDRWLDQLGHRLFALTTFS